MFNILDRLFMIFLYCGFVLYSEKVEVINDFR